MPIKAGKGGPVKKRSKAMKPAEREKPDNIEKKWQDLWYSKKAFEAEPDPKKPKWYMIFAYPTVSGTLHVGHARSYTLPDIIARYKRARGFNVFFPLGFHATGIDSQKIFDISQKEPAELAKYGIPPEKAKSFRKPLDVTHYLQDRMIVSFKQLGLSLDFRPVISTIDPPYNRFVQWQFRRLKENGYLIQRDHRVAWCPLEQHPVSLDPAEADIQEWKGAQIKDFVIIKFAGENSVIFPAATLRPETLPGATNLWVSPSGRYVEASVDSEKWVLSEGAIEKLKLLGKDIKILRNISGKDIIGKEVSSPFDQRKLKILSGGFVDAEEATGVVMSVPAHDPFDWIYLKTSRPEAETIQVVETEGLERDAAGGLIQKHHIKDPKDAKVADLVKEVYKLEWSRGRILPNVPVIGGLPVPKAKAKITEWLAKEGKADWIYEFSARPIHCRDGTEIVIKAVKGQWFVDYGNERLKEKAKTCIERMKVYPPEYQRELPAIIDWLEPRACVRRRGLGTEFPFEKGWIIEALSDSTIYMAFFVVSKWLNQKKIKESELTDEFFDFVFLGQGKEKSSTWRNIRDEFLYWYPLDINTAGKEHKQVHFPFFVLNHVAIWPEQFWPEGIAVNWHLIVNGQKMSKHLGNVVFWDQAIEKYGADAVRFYLAHGANQWFDFDWKNEEAERYRRQLEDLNRTFGEFTKRVGNKNGGMDKWMVSRLNHIINLVTNAFENGEIRKAADLAFFGVQNDIGWYLKRSGGSSSNSVAGTWLRLVAPIIPHTAERLWREIGNRGRVTEAGWPEYDGKAVNMRLEAGEDLIKNILGDISEIRKISGIERPSRITLIVSEPWKHRIYNEVVGEKELKAIMRIEEYRKIGQKIVDFANKLKRKGHLDELFLNSGDELEKLVSTKDFLESETGAKLEILQADKILKMKRPQHDPGILKKAEMAEPGKPGIILT